MALYGQTAGKIESFSQISCKSQQRQAHTHTHKQDQDQDAAVQNFHYPGSNYNDSWRFGYQHQLRNLCRLW